MKLELLHEVFEVVINPRRESSFSGFSCVIGNELNMECHSLLAKITADQPEQKVLSCLRYGCQTARPYCRGIGEKKNMNDGS